MALFWVRPLWWPTIFCAVLICFVVFFLGNLPSGVQSLPTGGLDDEFIRTLSIGNEANECEKGPNDARLFGNNDRDEALEVRRIEEEEKQEENGEETNEPLSLIQQAQLALEFPQREAEARIIARSNVLRDTISEGPDAAAAADVDQGDKAAKKAPISTKDILLYPFVCGIWRRRCLGGAREIPDEVVLKMQRNVVLHNIAAFLSKKTEKTVAADPQELLEASVKEGHYYFIDHLIYHGARVDQGASDGTPLLVLAQDNRHLLTAIALMRAGADVNVAVDNRPSLLFVACQETSAAARTMALTLIDYGADVDDVHEGKRLIDLVLDRDQDEILAKMIKAGVSLATMPGKRSLLMTTLQDKSGQGCLLELIRAGLHHWPPEELAQLMDVSLRGKFVDILHALIDAGMDLAKLAAENEDVETQIGFSVWFGGYEMLAVLLRTNIDIDAYFITMTALGHSIQEGELARVKLLLEHGADPNKDGPVHCSPLFTAVMYATNPATEEQLAIISALLDYGADIQHRHHQRDGYIDLIGYARHLRLYDVVKLLESHALSSHSSSYITPHGVSEEEGANKDDEADSVDER